MIRKPQLRSEVVSYDSDLLILVDSEDNEVGELDKAACHDGEGLLHRAFSLFVFNPQGQLLMQRRAKSKRLWGDYWSNSCCSHPRIGETMSQAVTRRCEQELGFAVDSLFVYKFEYAAQFGDCGSERELCSVFVAEYAGEPIINTEEASEYKWISPDELEAQFVDAPHLYTPWFYMEWRQLGPQLDKLLTALKHNDTRAE